MQEQFRNMTSQCQYLAFTRSHRSIVVTSQCYVIKDRPWRQWRNERLMIVFSGIVCSGHKIACKKWKNIFVTVNNDFLVTCEVICQWFSLVMILFVKIIGKSPHSWLKILINGDSSIILYKYLYSLQVMRWTVGFSNIKRNCWATSPSGASWDYETVWCLPVFNRIAVTSILTMSFSHMTLPRHYIMSLIYLTTLAVLIVLAIRW